MVQAEDRYSSSSIRKLFDEMAATYGIVNLVSSFGFCVVWRRQATFGLRLSEGSHVVDLMSGMNELCRSLSVHAPRMLSVTAVDMSPEMVRRARNDWPFRITTRLEDALTWDFESESADAVVSSFGLKTLNRDQQLQLSERVARLLRLGGVFSFVEISVPPVRLLRLMYLFYLNCVIPWIGRLFLGNPSNYRMLGVYTQEFGSCKHFAECLREQGMQVTETSHFFGCATGVRGLKTNRDGTDQRMNAPRTAAV